MSSLIIDALQEAEKITIGEDFLSETENNVFSNVSASATEARNFGIGCDKWLEIIHIDEMKFIKEKFKDEPRARTKSGKWKTRAFKDENGKSVEILPNRYVTARSVVGGAWKAGIDFAGVAKTQLQKEIREHKKVAAVRDVAFYEKKISNILTEARNKLSDSEYSELLSTIDL